MKMTPTGLAIYFMFTALVIVGWLQNQELSGLHAQVNELNCAIDNFVNSQTVIYDGNCGIQSGVEYDVFYIDYARGMAILKSKGENGKPEYTKIHGVQPEILKEWNLNRHFSG